MNEEIVKKIITFIQNTYKTKKFISLQEPKFTDNETNHVLNCIKSTYVSSVGEYVNKLEDAFQEYTGAQFAIATVNATTALHTTLIISGANSNTEVLLPALTFVGSANAIMHSQASPIFVDSEKNTFGMCPEALLKFLQHCTYQKDGKTYNKDTGKHIIVCMVVHIFGHPAKIDDLKIICDKYNIILIEDASESLGSTYRKKHTGTFGEMGVFSLNGNKIITAGAGGIIVTNNKQLAKKAKHITTTAKIPHKYEYYHDEVGFNYRMPNLNAALGYAQMERLDYIIEKKRKLALQYQQLFSELKIPVVQEPINCKSNYWLNAIITENKHERNAILDFFHKKNIGARPIWQLINTLPMYSKYQTTDLSNATWIADRVINIPSGLIK